MIKSIIPSTQNYSSSSLSSVAVASLFSSSLARATQSSSSWNNYSSSSFLHLSSSSSSSSTTHTRKNNYFLVDPTRSSSNLNDLSCKKKFSYHISKSFKSSASLQQQQQQHSMEEYFHLGHILCDQHIKANEDSIALNYFTEHGKFQYTYQQLSEWSMKFGEFLKSLKLKRQERVAVFLPKCPEQMIAGLAIWRNAFTYVPLFTAFGPDAVKHRVFDSEARIIITDENNVVKLEPIWNELRERGVKVIVAERGVTEAHSFHHEGEYSLPTSLNRANPEEIKFWKDGILSSSFDITRHDDSYRVKSGEGMRAEDIMVLLYTSGTTGKIPVTTKSLGAFETYMKYGLHVEEDDVFLNLADSGWAYGLYYNVLGVQLLGKPTYFVHRPFKPSTVYEILQNEKITNFAAAPTAYRAMKAEGLDLARQYKFYIKKASSAGEPLNPEVVRFFEEIWNTRIQSHYGQTEHGMLINNHHHPEYATKNISETTTIGTPMPGFTLTLLDDAFKEITEPYVTGHLVIDINNSPSRFFTGYWNQPEKTREKMVQSPSYPDGRYFEMTGDTAYRDQNGHYFFSGRSDDIITSCGYRIGPKEVEDCLIEHPGVRESGVVGKQDELRGEMVVAFVVLRPGFTPSKELEAELCEFVKKKLSAHQYPREIYFEEQLPTTEAGKIRRNVLREKANQNVAKK
ncbi:hypothetical protein FDP41_013638 [Naegleria fowleri]|uniref:medium-chain acyl-CoA ligase n=1 Tax=Naegleria fowleri TaxID=5763 RepID=A0A6A5C1J2_NAEFO|nr:uncharacterized protein FDP41_013638 [Naegleria fowleri]KAF0980424.1 hypothetical protein FDP41_013638 [Naegleria fowleri]